jgi:hypothetical protein
MAPEIKPHQLIANLMTASAPLEKYLRDGGPLTDLEVESIAVTVGKLKIYFDFCVWQRTHAQKTKSSDINSIVGEPPVLPIKKKVHLAKKNPAAVALGRLGGPKGGKARAKSLTKKERKTIALNAAKARWKHSIS